MQVPNSQPVTQIKTRSINKRRTKYWVFGDKNLRDSLLQESNGHCNKALEWESDSDSDVMMADGISSFCSEMSKL